MHLKIYPVMILLVLLASCAASKKQAVMDHYQSDESWSGFVARFGEPDSYTVDYESEDKQQRSATAIYTDFAGSDDLVVSVSKKRGKDEYVHNFSWRE